MNEVWTTYNGLVLTYWTPDKPVSIIEINLFHSLLSSIIHQNGFLFNGKTTYLNKLKISK